MIKYKLQKNVKSNSGFTLVEILVVISVITFMASAAMYLTINARMKGRDTRRIADLTQIRKAIELYYNDFGNYPLVGYNQGECLGDQDSSGNNKVGIKACGAQALAEIQLKNYISNMPNDPKHNHDCGTIGSSGIDCADYALVNDFFYSIDALHAGCTGPVIAINRFESKSFLNKFKRNDITAGADMIQDQSDYNICIIK